ncbi:MAG: helix-turn-helix domain-containing protein [Bacillota bacterium]|jgi:cytoskeleton protein RodZ
MKEIGSYLREVREKRSISQAMVEDATKIPMRYIQAIEDGDFSILPGRAYTIGFIRTYAKFLQVDSDELIDFYKENNPDEEDAPVIYNNRNEGCESFAINRAPGKKLNIKRLLLFIIIAAAVVVALLFFFVWGDNNSGILNQSQNPVTDTSSDTVSNNGTTADSDNVVNPPESPLTVKVMATNGTCDLSVETDEEDNIMDLSLDKGMQISFTADQYIKIHYSDAGAVDVEVNGEKQPSLGEDNQAVDKEYNIDQL